MAESATVGAVLVVGGGIAGMQAALDLADSGYKVYLSDKQGSIGGTMSQLDKTFPSNDCAMCILAPKLVGVGRHLNIDILPHSELIALEGEAGRFKATLRRRGTFIDPDRCTGCGECSTACPVDLPNEFNLGLSKRKAISRRFPQAVPAQFAISKSERPPCQSACAAGTNVQGYVALLSKGKFAEALAVVRQRMPFASVCGRICVNRCEPHCNRGVVDEPVSIMRLKRFLADWDVAIAAPMPAPVEKTKSARIAIVGGGPAGLTCAHDLARQGHPVTVFDAAPKLGGMLRTCVPKFRLPEDVLDRDIEYLLSPGIEVVTNAAIGRDFTLDELERRGFAAVFLATGANKPRMLPLPGKELAGITGNLDFLQKARVGDPVDLAGDVLVLGGGNVAFDVARTARRLTPGKVTMACLESRATMPAHKSEIAAALEESVDIINDVTFKEYIGAGGHVTGVRVRRISSMSFDGEGRLSVTEIEGSDFTIPADRVIVAIGQSPDLGYLKDRSGVNVSRRGLVEVDPETMLTERPGVFAGGDLTLEEAPRMRIFAGGDVVTGTAFVVDAVAAGHRAAESIACYLEGKAFPKHEPKKEPARLSDAAAEQKLRSGEVVRSRRPAVPHLAAEQRAHSFDECEGGLTEAAAVAEAARCLACGLCSECLQCVGVCQAHAIDHSRPREEAETLDVGAVILAPGLAPFDATRRAEYGHKRYPNVVTSLEFERLLSPTGPYMGKVLRPSDQKPPQKVAFIQCVGSREVGHEYCSTVCCMYTAKQAIIAKEHQEGLDCTVFYIDLRAVGKGFESYIDRAREIGVRYIRCRPSAIIENPKTRNLDIEYVDEQGKRAIETFDMAVLATGLTPDESIRGLARTTRIDLDSWGFCATPSFTPQVSSRRGVFVAGMFNEPMDIPETVTSASAAAAEAMRLLADSRGTLVRPKEYPPERDVSGQEPRVGVFICHCGTNIAGVVDVEKVVQYAQTLPNVVHAERNLYTCSDDTQKRIREKIHELDLNRVIVASCTPRTHEALFQDTIREAGLNPYYFELANIRDQCSWVHMHEKEKATEKAKDLVRISLAKARLDTALYKRPLNVTQSALVIGAGVAGMNAAVTLADQGFKVFLVEQNRELGGHARTRQQLLSGDDPRWRLHELSLRVRKHPNIELFMSSRVTAVSGSLANFHTTITRDEGATREIAHGAIIVATGADPYVPSEFLFGSDPRVLTNAQVEERLANGGLKSDSVVFIQCVGSRNSERQYCSRMCCTETVRNALQIKKKNPNTNVTVLYRDIRTYGYREVFYRQAREKGVRFVRYDAATPPLVAQHNGHMRVTTLDELTHTPVTIDADTIVLATGTLPNPANKELAQLLKVPLTQDGFFLEAHRKLRPVDFANDGIFICGAAHSPMGIRSAIAQSTATAARAATILSRAQIDLDPTISHVGENCDGCAYCVDPCPFHAITLVEYQDNGNVKKRVRVDEAVCKGCGTCQATCPKNAIAVWHFRPEQLVAQVHAALGIGG